MIEVTFYKNGFEINGHARVDICGEFSLMSWTFANLTLDGQEGDWYASCDDNSNAGYTHFTFDPEEGQGRWLMERFRVYLESWGNEFKWFENGHVAFTEREDNLVILSNFKELKGIIPMEG